MEAYTSSRQYMPFTRPEATQWIRGPQLPSTPAIFNNGQLRVVPWFLEGVTIDQLAIEVTTIGGAGSVHRIGVYADNGSFYPGAVLFDSGPLATDVLGVAAVAAPMTLPPICWVGAVQQGAPAPGATLRSLTGAGGYELRGLDFASIAAQSATGYSTVGTTGALPPTFFTGNSIGFNAPSVAARVA